MEAPAEPPAALVDHLSASFPRSTVREWLAVVPRPALRRNPLKAPREAVLGRLRRRGIRLDPVPWSRDCFFIEGDAASTPEHTLGHVYLQDAASMVPALALDVSPGMLVLDLCAAPGTKTGILAVAAGDDGLVVANERSRSRAGILGGNLQRLGVTNTVVTCRDGGSAAFGVGFDRVLVDAPCSNAGSARTRAGKIRWDASRAEALAPLQRRLLANGYRQLRPGGILVYSTCSLDPRENEEVIDAFFAARADAEPVERPRRIAPTEHGTEAFFVAKVRKPEDAPPPRAGRAPPAPDPGSGVPLDDGEAARHRIEGRWAADLGPLRMFRTARRLFGAAGPSVLDAMTPYAFRIGFCLGKEDEAGFRLSVDAAMRYAGARGKEQGGDGQEATRVWLSDGDLGSWLEGLALHGGDAPEGPVYLEHDGLVVGSGVVRNGRVQNWLPGHRRIRRPLL